MKQIQTIKVIIISLVISTFSMNAYANQTSPTQNNNQQYYYISAINVDEHDNVNVGLDLDGLKTTSLVYTYKNPHNQEPGTWNPIGQFPTKASQIWGITSFAHSKNIDVAAAGAGNLYYNDYTLEWSNAYSIESLIVSQVARDHNDNLYYISSKNQFLLPLKVIQNSVTDTSVKPKTVYTNDGTELYPSYIDSGRDGFVYVIGDSDPSSTQSEIYKISSNSIATNTATSLNWKSETNGLQAISVDADANGNVFALVVANNNYQIWENSNGTWSQISNTGLSPVVTHRSDSQPYLGELKIDHANRIYLLNISEGIIYKFLNERQAWFQINKYSFVLINWSANNNFDFDSNDNLYYIASTTWLPPLYKSLGYNCVVKIDSNNETNSILGDKNIMPNNNCQALINN